MYQYLYKNDIFNLRRRARHRVSNPMSTMEENIPLRRVEHNIPPSTSGKNWKQILDKISLKDLTEENLLSRIPYPIHELEIEQTRVVIKRFPEKSRQAYMEEMSIVKKLAYAPDSIHRFITNYERSLEGPKEYWIVREYCVQANLNKYLREHTLGPKDLVRMAHSISVGLNCLHDSRSRSAIAHRDLNPGNVLVRRDLTCALTHFDMAVTSSQNLSDHEDMGTPGYVAPEFLHRHFQPHGERPSLPFNSYLKGDVFSFSIILWQMMNRTKFGDEDASPHRPPYDEMTEELYYESHLLIFKDRIFRSGKRPALKQQWAQDPIGSKMQELMVAAWAPDPDERPSSSSLEHELSSLLYSIEKSAGTTC